MTTKSYNLKTDFGGYGDAQKVFNVTLSIAHNGYVLSSPTAIWTPGGVDDGKRIGFPMLDTWADIGITQGAVGVMFFGSSIATGGVAGDGKSVTLVDQFTWTTMSNVTGQSVEWGHSDQPAFEAFNAAALIWQAAHPTDIIELNLVGPGRFTCGAFTIGGDINNFNLVFSGGAILSNCNGGLVSGNISVGFPAGVYVTFLGSGRGLYEDRHYAARLASVTAGETSVFVIPAADLPAATTIADAIAIFTVGDWAMISGIDLQGGGYPTNPGFHDWVHITGLNSTTGEITFTPPLNHYYKSTWPRYTGPTGYDGGGPATISRLQPGWGITHNYINAIMDCPTGYGSCGGKDITWTNATFITATLSSAGAYLGSGGYHPTTNLNYRMIGGNIGKFQMEVDKMVSNCTFSGVTGEEFSNIVLQSGSSCENFTIDGCTIYNNHGTARHHTITDTTFTGSFGPAPNYGRTESITLTNCVIPEYLQPGKDPRAYYGGSLGINNVSGISMTSGVITIPRSTIIGGSTTWWLCEGNWCAWRDGNAVAASPPYFQITDITHDTTNIYVHTTWPGGFPTWSFNTVLGIQVHPCLSMTVTDVAANDPPDEDDGSYLYGLSQGPAGIPLMSYQKVTFTETTPVDSTSYFPILGYIKKYIVTVNTAVVDPSFTNTLIVQPQFGTRQFFNSSYTPTAYDPTINMEAVGTRSLIVPTGASYPISWTGTIDGGDTLPNLTEALWWPAPTFRNMSTDHVGRTFSITLELQTDQGIDVARTFTCTFT